MNTSVSDSRFIQVQAVMLRLCMGLFLLGAIVEAGAAQPQQDLIPTKPDLLAIQLEHYDSMQISAYRFGTRVGIADTAENVPGALRIGGTSDMPDFNKLLKLPSWVASISWHLASDSGRASLSPNLRVESNQTLVVIKPIEHSAWMVWHWKLD